jgi:Ca2+/Na+ antiporter
MDITFFHFAALFFGLVTLYNVYSARKYGESYLPVLVGIMMLISLVLFIFLPWQYGYIAFLLTMMFSVAMYRKSCDIHKEKMKRFIRDSKDNDSLKLIDYFTGWKLLHRWNKNYGPKKASFINSFIMWIFGIVFAFLITYIWPDTFGDMNHNLIIIMTVAMLGFYWQNKRLLESLDDGNPAEE